MSAPAGKLSNEPLLELLEDVGAFIWKADPGDLRVLSIISRADSIFSYSKEEWCAEGFLRRVAEREAFEQLEEAARTGEAFSVDLPLTTRNGSLAWARLQSRPRNAPDAPISGLGIDVSIQKRSELALIDSQKRYRYFVEHTRDIIYSVNLKGKITFVNAAAPRVLNSAAEDLAGHHFLDFIRPDYRSIVRRFYLHQLRQREPTTYFEVPVITGDGTYIWIGQNVQLVVDNERPLGFQGIARDLTEQKRAEQALRESEERYRIVAETATDAILTFDASGEILFANHSVEKIFGFSVDEIVGQRLEMLLPTYPRKFQQSFAWVDLSAAQSYLGTEAISLGGRHRNGSDLHLEATLGEFAEAGKNLFTAVIRDTTERKRVEEAIRRSDQRFRSLIENASDIITILDSGGGVLYASPSVYRILGYHPDDLIGAYSVDLVDPNDREHLSRAFYRSLEREGLTTSDPLEFRVRHHDGSWRVMEAMARNLVNDAAVRGYVVNLRDITDRKHAEEQLREANETLQTLIQTSPLSIIAMDANGRIVKWNSAAERMFGWLESEILGATSPIVPPDKSEEALELFGILRRGQSLTVDTIRQKRNGTLLNVTISAAAMRNADGSFGGAVAIINDLTERKQLEDQLRQAQKMEAVGQLAGGIAHDFNNLLTVITGYNQLLLNLLDETERPRVYAREIMQAAERASSLTRQLLAFSRRQVSQPRILDLNPVLEGMRSMLDRLVGDSVELVMALDSKSLRINADPVQLEQIVLNLTVNARDAMPDGGRLTIETGLVGLTPEYSRTHVSARPGPHVMLAVTDTGHGMDEETRRRVFEPFFTTKDIGKGTGLGLSTVYGIVQQNNATIWVYSEEGLGTTFKVYFPLAVSVQPAPSAPQNQPTARGSETVLLVEHEPGLRSLIEELLANLGYSVLAASTRDEADEVCRYYPERIHLLLSDVVMPDTTGQDLAELLLAHRPDMRVLYMSGYPGEAVVRNGLISASMPFLQKPFSQDILAQKIREVLES